DWVLDLVPVQERNLLAASLSNGSINIFDLKKLAAVHSFQPHSNSISCCKLINDDINFLGSCSANENLKFFDLRSNGIVEELSCSNKNPFISFNSKFNQLAIGSELFNHNAELYIYDLRNLSAPIKTYYDCHNDDITSINFHPTNKNFLLTGSTDGYINLYDLSIQEEEDALYQVANFESIHSCNFLSEKFFYGLSHVEKFSVFEINNFSKGNEDKLVESKPKEFGDLREKLNSEYVVDIYPGFIASGSINDNQNVKIHFFNNFDQINYDNPIIIPNCNNNEVVRSVYIPYDKPDNKMIFTAGENNSIDIWQLQNQDYLHVFKNYSNY
ncbi:uncharacterized protein ASCRUDRAFT_23390, partial [Ascoidea rubescens DSM 1968]